MGPEKTFENKVKDFLIKNGIYPLGIERNKMTITPIGYYEKRFANRNTKKGLPDMHVSILGKTLEIELKSDNGKPSELQLHMCYQIIASGAKCCILYPSGFKEFKSIIKNMSFEKDVYFPLIIH